jgi:cyclopropane fatty-acyl-phospholipid synthase-like methyltransferase
VTDPRIALVTAAYDALGDDWEAWKTGVSEDPRDAWCDELFVRLQPGAHVLELGCGGGTDETQRLAERFRLTGVDLSVEQLRRARVRVPGAEFVRADLTELDVPPESFDAVAAFYVLNHVPRELLPDLFSTIRGALVPGGLFLTTLGASDLPGWTGEWLGQPTFFAGFEPDTNRRLLSDAGLVVLRDEVVPISEPEGDATFHWVLARR